jgi:hypothetical protein
MFDVIITMVIGSNRAISTSKIRKITAIKNIVERMVVVLIFSGQNREYGRRDPSRWPRGTLYPQKLAITSPTNDGRSVGIVRPRTQTMEFSFSRQTGWLNKHLLDKTTPCRVNIFFAICGPTALRMLSSLWPALNRLETKHDTWLPPYAKTKAAWICKTTPNTGIHSAVISKRITLHVCHASMQIK